jgi:hypothetical protein
MRMMMLPQKQLYHHQQQHYNISDEEDDSSHSSSNISSNPTNKSVSFDETVTVHPIFQTSIYPSSILHNIYTKREELRINKLRNKREYAYDNNDWYNVTEEDGMEVDEESGEYVHPVHSVKRTWTRGPFLSSGTGTTGGSIWSGGGGMVKSKRMRMYYP